MVPKSVFMVFISTIVMACSGVAIADEYRPDEFLHLDLSKAVLSPKPLGPASGFTPGPLDVNIDHGSADTQASVEPKAGAESKVSAEPKVSVEPEVSTEAKAEPTIAVKKTRVVRAEKTRGAARAKLARHRNPLDAQAFDTRIQVWPCRSGGICNWR
jgi:hypothetical protein